MSLMRRSSRSKKLAIITVGLLVVTAVTGAYHYFIYFPGKQEEERIRSLMEYAGFTKEEAIKFDKLFKNYAPYNQTLLDFAKFLKAYPLTTSEIFRLTNSFPITVSSLKNVELIISEIVTGDQKAKDFVLRYPSLVLDDGINATDASLMFYNFHIQKLTSYIIENVKDQSGRISTLNLSYPNILNKTLTEDQVLEFLMKYPNLLPLNQSSLALTKLWPKVPTLVDFLIEKYPVDIASSSILFLYPNILNGTFIEKTPIDFISIYPDLVKDGINPFNLQYVKFYYLYPTLTDSTIQNIPLELGIPIIFNLNPFLLNKTFTENKAAYFISLYPNLTKSFGLHRDFPRLVYLFTQLPRSTDVGIKTIEDFEFLVKTIYSILSYIDETKKNEEKIAFFIEKYPELIKKYDWDEGNRKIFEFHERYPALTDTLLKLKIKRDFVLSTIENVRPYLKEVPESTINDFVKAYEHLVLDDGLNSTDVRLLPYFNEYRLLTDAAIKELKSLDSILFVLDSYYPYMKKGEITSFRLRDYILRDVNLFRIKEYVHPLADPDEDYVNNITEMKNLDDIFFGIGNFTWTLTKVINSKVYEGNTYVRAKSLRGILPSKLYWIPINYTQFPLEVRLRAFPNETIREFNLIPSNENLIESIIPIKDFKGGREYKIEIVAKDKIGNVAKRSLTTPYLREFEKITSDKFTILSLLWTYPFAVWDDPWTREMPNGPKREPLLGYYNPMFQKIVREKHIDWATGHGIVFLVECGSEEPEKGWGKPEELFLKYLNETDLGKDFRFAFFLGTGAMKRIPIPYDGRIDYYIDLNDEWNINYLIGNSKYIARYFKLPNYLKMDGKPIIYIDGSQDFYGDIKGAANIIRESVKEIYGESPFLIGGFMHPWWDVHIGFENNLKRALEFGDGVSGWIGYDETGQYWNYGSYEKCIEAMLERWSKKATDLVIIPYSVPGMDMRHNIRGNPNQIPIEKDLDLIRIRLEMIKKYGKAGIVMFGTWNDYGEDTNVEPTTDMGFSILKLIKDVFYKGNHSK